jgi:hypothetical protein
MHHMPGTKGIKVSHWNPTVVAHGWFQVRSCEICDGQSGTEVGFFQVLQFSLPMTFPPTSPHPFIILLSL